MEPEEPDFFSVLNMTKGYFYTDYDGLQLYTAFTESSNIKILNLPFLLEAAGQMVAHWWGCNR